MDELKWVGKERKCHNKIKQIVCYTISIHGSSLPGRRSRCGVTLTPTPPHWQWQYISAAIQEGQTEEFVVVAGNHLNSDSVNRTSVEWVNRSSGWVITTVSPDQLNPSQPTNWCESDNWTNSPALGKERNCASPSDIIWGRVSPVMTRREANMLQLLQTSI